MISDEHISLKIAVHIHRHLHRLSNELEGAEKEFVSKGCTSAAVAVRAVRDAIIGP